MSKNVTLDQVKSILERGDFEELTGAVENEWLECKAAPYQLERDNQKQELAKDVSALANAEGGLILIGVRTERDPTHFGDEIKEVRIFSQDLVDPNQYHDVLKRWIYPVPQQLEVKWFASASEPKKGVLALLIPPQSSVCKPLLITRTVDIEGKHTEIVFGYAERRRAGVEPKSVQELHALIKEGSRVNTLDRRLESIEQTLGQIGLQQGQARSEVAEADFSKLLGERISTALIAAELVGLRSFSLGAIPLERVEISTIFESRDADVVRLLEHPPELRWGGFDLDTGSPARIVRGQLRRAMSPKAKIIDLWRDGTLTFAATADEDFLCWGSRSGGGGPLRINPLVLIEATYLFVELSRLIFEKTEPAEPKCIQYRLELENMNIDGQETVLIPGPLKGRRTDLHRAPEKYVVVEAKFADLPVKPGRVAFLLVREVYRWFGIEDSAIPYKEQVDGDYVISPDQIRKAGA